MSGKKADTGMEREKEIERYLVGELKKIGVLCLKWTCPGTSGVPDRIVLGNRSNVYFVELKRPKGYRTAPLQKRWQARLKQRGFQACIIHDRAEADAFVLLVKRDEEKGKTL